MVKRWNNSLRFVGQMGCIGLGRFGCLRLVSLCFSFFMFFPDLVLLGADPFFHPVISRSFPFHYFPILFPSYPFLSHPQYSVGLQDLPPERLQDRLENDGSQADLCWFAGFFKDTGWTLCHTNPYEWIQVGCGTLVLFWNGPHASPCRFFL